MAEPIRVNSRILIPVTDLSYEYSRASGPGGQHVQTADTRVRLRFDLRGSTAISNAVKARIAERAGSLLTDGGEILITSDTHRSRFRNTEEVRERLAELIRQCLTPPKVRRATRPTKGSQKRRVEGKKRRGNIKANRGKVQGEG